MKTHVSQCGSLSLRAGRLCYPQLSTDQILNPASNHQRLRNTAQGREDKFFVCVAYRARGEVDFDAVAGNDGLLLSRGRVGESLTHTIDQLRCLDTQESVFECFAQVGPRDAV